MTSDPFKPPELPSLALTVPPEEPAEKGETSLEPDERSKFGYIIDKDTGLRRPKKRPGRTVGKPAEAHSTDRDPDMVPGSIVKPETQRRRRGRAPREQPELGPFRAGPIAKGVNALYLKAGKIVRAMDHDIGTAIIATTRSEGEDDITVGQAWEEIAKVNPRIRRVLMRLIEGGAWSQLLMAHAPILLALLLKERVARRIPFARMASSFLDDSDDGSTPPPSESGMSGLFGGLTQDDLSQAFAAFNQFMPNIVDTSGGGMDFAGGNPTRPAVVDEFGGDV